MSSGGDTRKKPMGEGLLNMMPKLLCISGLRSLNPRSGCVCPHSVCLYWGGEVINIWGTESYFPEVVRGKCLYVFWGGEGASKHGSLKFVFQYSFEVTYPTKSLYVPA